MRIWEVEVSVRWKKGAVWDSLGATTVNAEGIEEAIKKAIAYETKDLKPKPADFEVQSAKLLTEVHVE